MKEKSFFAKPPQTATPQPVFIDHRKRNSQNPQPHLDKALDKLSGTLEASHIVKEVVVKTNSLQDAYQKRKEETSSFFKKYLMGTSAERPEEINFILSVAASIDIDTSFSTTLNFRSLSFQTKRLEEMTRLTPLIIDGAYLLVQQEIEETYLHAWYSKDPRSSQLFVELTERLGEKSVEDKKACLTALQNHLQSAAIQQKINFGTKSVEKVLSQLSDQLASLTSTSTTKSL